MSTPQRVLVTGSAGRIGRAAVAELTARGHTVIGYDIRLLPFERVARERDAEKREAFLAVDHGDEAAAAHLFEAADEAHALAVDQPPLQHR